MDFYGLQDSLREATSSLKSSSTTSIDDRYCLEEQIGKGEYGIVWKGRKKTGEKDDYYAIKQINLRHAGAKGLKDVLGEVEIMSMLTHPNIVRLEETFRDGTSLWIVMEYLAGGELQQNLAKEKHFSEDKTRMLVIQLLQALEYIHNYGIVHRDLKPANCLLNNDDDTIKISDFGFAVLGGSAQCLRTYCGTAAFMAPEIMCDKNYGKPVDMWALGVMTYTMYVGKLPFSGENANELIESISRGKDSISSNKSLKQTPLLLDFILGLLTEDPNKRLNARNALRHDWIVAGIRTSSMKRSRTEQKLSTISLPSTSQRGLHRFRAITTLILAAHRLIFFKGLRFLKTMGVEEVPMLRSWNFILTGKFTCKETSLDCSEVFFNKPAALEYFLSVLQTVPGIEKIDFSKNYISSLSEVQTLLKFLSTHPSIIEANLSNNPIPPLAGKGILRLARNPACKLRHIFLAETNIPPDIIQQIYMVLREKVRTMNENNVNEGEKINEIGGKKTEGSFSKCSFPCCPGSSKEISKPILSQDSPPSSESNSFDNFTFSLYTRQSPLERQSIPRGYRPLSFFSNSSSPASSHSLQHDNSRVSSKKRSTRLPPLPHAALPKTNKRCLESV